MKLLYLRKSLLLMALVLVSLLSTGCGGDKGLSVNKEFKSVAELKESELTALSQKSFYFGHQSVGVNVVDGLKMLMADYPLLKLNIEVSEDPSMVQTGAFLHSRIGENGKPKTKITAFENVLDNGFGNKVDVAFLKFCYVDTNQPVVVEDLFQDYKNRIAALKVKYPLTTFVHFTMPIRTVPTGWKVTIKNLIGKDIPAQQANALRGQFNELLRAEYLGKEPVFDIARFESVVSTGKHYGFKQDGKHYEALAPENTYDGGHLSDQGKRWIAEQLIVFLAALEYKS